MNIIRIVILLIAYLWHGVSISNVQYDEESRRAAIALNHLHSSLNKIITYNDKIVLEQEYDNIINNINLMSIEDYEIVDTITYIMDTLVQFKITEEEKNILKKEYVRRLDSSLKNSIRSSARKINMKNIVGAVTGGVIDPITAAISVVSVAGGMYTDYRNNQKQYKAQMDKGLWTLKKENILELNDIRKDFIQTYWRIMKRYGMPDKWRITESQFQKLHNILKGDDDAKQYRQLKRMEDELSILPGYWFELSLVARKLKNKEAELNAINRYELLNDQTLRKNMYHSLLLANKTMHLDITSDQEEIIINLEKIYKIDPDNAERKVFLALKYLELGDIKNAERLLNENIDDDFLVAVSRQFLIEGFLDRGQDKKYLEAIETLIEEQNLNASDYLFYLGKRPLIALVKEIESQVEGIQIDWSRSTYGKDNLDILLPKKWVLNDIENTDLTISINKEVYKPVEISQSDNLIEFSFNNVFDYEYFSKEGNKEIQLQIVVNGIESNIVYDVEMIKTETKAETETKTEKDDNSSWGISTFGFDTSRIKESISDQYITLKDATSSEYKSIQKYIGAAFKFKPISIHSNEKCFDLRKDLSPCN